MPYTRRKLKRVPFYLKKIIFDFKKKLDKIKKKGKGKVVKGSFGLTFNKIKNNKDNIKKKALSLKKRERVIIIH